MIGIWELVLICAVLLVFALVVGAAALAVFLLIRSNWREKHPVAHAHGSSPPGN